MASSARSVWNQLGGWGAVLKISAGTQPNPGFLLPFEGAPYQFRKLHHLAWLDLAPSSASVGASVGACDGGGPGTPSNVPFLEL